MENCKHVTAIPPVLMRILSNCYTIRLDFDTATNVLERIVFGELGVNMQGISRKFHRNSCAAEIQEDSQAYKKYLKPKMLMGSRLAWHALKLGACYSMQKQHSKAKDFYQWILDSQVSKERWTVIIIAFSKRYTTGKSAKNWISNAIFCRFSSCVP